MTTNAILNARTVIPFMLGCIVSSVFLMTVNHFTELSNSSIPNNDDNNKQHRFLFGLQGRYGNHHPQQVLYDNYQGGAPPRFLLGIFSTVEEKERRQKLREYIFRNPSRPDPRLCSLTEYLQWEQDRIDNGCQVVYTFVVGAGDDNGPANYRSSWGTPILVDHESLKNRNMDVEPDVTYLNIKENMNDGKTPAWFKFATSLNHRPSNNNNETPDGDTFQYVAKMDSDTLLSVPDLLHMLNGDLPRTNAYGGILCDQAAACMSHTIEQKLRTCVDVLHGRVYMTGQFYFVSADLASYASDDDLDRNAISSYSEDVDFGMWLHASNRILKLVVLNNKNVFWLHELKTHDKMDAKYTDYFARLRKFPMYSFWLKPNWWP